MGTKGKDVKQIIFDRWYDRIGNLVAEREVAEAVFELLQKRILGEVKRERKRYRKALREIQRLNPAHTQEGYNEWGEAYCFQRAQVIADEALEDVVKPAPFPPAE